MGVYGRIYPGHTSKKIIVICKFVTFSLLRLGWNTEYSIANNLQQLLRCFLLLLFARRREKMDNTEGGLKEKLMEARLIIKTDNYL